MHLVQIKISGFKSFVDPMNITLPGRLVGIVGPNGCGKSNIIDAVRWVLGETRASALRGETMQDVIFNGSTSRKPVGRASVELVFDNSLGKAGGQWARYGEIAVRRVIERDGESSYYVNNLHVRRRDVTDIFLGTGLGGRAYAIIEQGMISRIIEAKPEELRVFLEEAAGVSRYRERRKDTESRLSDARDNLARVDDIRQELGGRIEELEQQARVAARYRELQSELHTVQCLLSLVRQRDAQSARERHEREVARLANEIEAGIARQREIEARLEGAREAHYSAGDAVQQSQGAFYSAGAEVSRLEQQLAHVRDSRERLEQQIASHDSQLRDHERQADASSANLVHWRGEYGHALEQARQRAAAAAEVEQALPALEEALRAAQQTLSAVEREGWAADQNRQMAEARREQASAAIGRDQARRQRLEEEAAGLPQVDEAALEALRAGLAELAVRLAGNEQQAADLGAALPRAEAALREAQADQRSAEEALTRVRARRGALQQLQERLESDAKLKAWLARHGLEHARRLWQELRLEEGWDDAVEAVLRERLNAVAVEDLGTAVGWGEDLPPGKLALAQAVSGTSAQPAAAPAGSLRERVQVRDAALAPALDDWLAGVSTARSLSEALERRGELGFGQVLVTPQGHLVTRSGLGFYAPDSELHGVLAREREIEALGAEETSLVARTGEARERVATAEQQLQGLRRDLEGARQRVGEARQQHHAAELDLVRRSETIQRARSRREQIAGEIAEIGAAMDGESATLSAAEDELEALAQSVDEIRQRIQGAREAAAEAEEQVVARRKAAREAIQAAQEANYYEKVSENKIKELEDNINVINENIQRDRERIENLTGQLAALDPQPVERDLGQALEVRRTREQSLAASRDALEQAVATLRELEQERMTTERGLEPLRERLSEVRVKEQEARTLEAQYGEQLAAAGGDPEALQALLVKGTRSSTLQTDIRRLTEDMEALGAVNLAALDELERARERKGYLDSQSDDLRQAVETLESAIRRIDRETRERLLVTFEQVNGYLSDTFPLLFGGGQAKLVLTGEEILDSGVQVMAQPPGKKNTSIHLLSGGEKALTALSLVFSLFQLNPAPFCLLDEVDAPLDDTNTERFCQLVRKLASDTQFMFVTHNKITMELANQLIGITMQEQGVSRMVAVDIEEALGFRDAVPALQAAAG